MSKEPKECPECRHVFQGNGWEGIDAHWRAHHEDVMLYKDAWPLLEGGTYGCSHEHDGKPDRRL